MTKQTRPHTIQVTQSTLMKFAFHKKFFFKNNKINQYLILLMNQFLVMKLQIGHVNLRNLK